MTATGKLPPKGISTGGTGVSKAKDPQGGGVDDAPDGPSAVETKKPQWRVDPGTGRQWGQRGTRVPAAASRREPALGTPSPKRDATVDPSAVDPLPRPPGPYDAAFEKAFLQGKNKPGKIFEIDPGTGTGHASLTIHGINGSPDDIKPFATEAIKNGDQVMSFAYDSHFRRLWADTDDLKAALNQWFSVHPNEALSIDAHSLGGRILLETLKKMDDAGDLEGKDLSVRLMSPFLNGSGAANSAKLTPPGLDKLIPNIAPGKDVGTHSKFQMALEDIVLPGNIDLTVFTGGKDTTVPADDPRLQKIIKNLGATEIRLPNATHDTVVEQAADYVREHSSDDPKKP